MIAIDRSHGRALYLQIAEGVIRAVCEGQLQAGRRLPGSRKLAALLEVNRKTAELAYEELMAQGWVDIRPSRGVFVVADLPVSSFRTITGGDRPGHGSRSEPIHPVYSSTIPPYQSPPPHRLLVGEGSPDVRLAPMETLIKNYRALVRSYRGYKLLGYGDVQGAMRSRQILADYLQQTRGLDCRAEQILFTRGSQMGIYLFLRTLIKPGDRILVSEPNYDVADWTVAAMGGVLVRAPVDTDGLDMAEVEALCRKHQIRAAYITPHHHFPTTVTLSAQRRLQLLELARKYHFFILEDDYDYAFHYEGAPILPLASIDRFERIVYLGSFSKLLAPAVRVGYLVASPDMAVELGKLRRIVDRQGDPILESAVCQMIADGDLQRHLKKVLRIYRQRRDQFCALLEKELGPYLFFNLPEGGMAVWIRLREPVDGDQLLAYCQDRGLYLDVDRELLANYNSLRLGFAALTGPEMADVIDILGSFFKRSR